jgi:hypothetical protein
MGDPATAILGAVPALIKELEGGDIRVSSQRKSASFEGK